MDDFMQDLTSKTEKRFYPHLEVKQPKNPNKLYAVPLIGILIKIIILIPVFLFSILIALATLVVYLINPFYILINGKYMKLAYDVMVACLTYSSKVTLFMQGITDKYPWFNFKNTEDIKLHIKMPAAPNKLYAVPLIGLILRLVLMIPYFIFAGAVANGANLGIMFAGWIFVLFQGKYPESLYEIGRDSLRLQLGSSVYMSGLSDTYPSFWISFNNKTVKIILIILGFLALFGQFSAQSNDDTKKELEMKYNFEKELPGTFDSSRFD